MRFHFSKLIRSIIFLGIVSFVIIEGTTSCVSPKSIVYFQGDTARFQSSKIVQTYVPTIAVNDMLSIVVGSLSAEANAIFNSANDYTSSSVSYGAGSSASRQPFGYLVDSEGQIELPLVGKIKVEGLRIQTAADTIRNRLLVYLKEPSVNIKNLNFKVSVLGEVNRPAVYVIPDEKITLPEILSLAGDLTIYGKRSNIMIIREERGERQYARIDLTSRAIFESPFYYLHKNDVVYVEPIKARMNTTDRTIQLAPIILSAVTALTLVFYRFRVF